MDIVCGTNTVEVRAGSPTSATGTGWERTPWHATQRTAWEALKESEEDD